MTLKAGTALGPYEILAPLGAGAMGEVYRARDSRLNRDVAIKVLPDGTASSSESLSRFAREAQAIAALTHPNIPAIYDLGTHGSTAFIVMELVEGETLRALLGRGRLAWRTATQIGLAIADGLAAAHSKGIVHRDLKPENVLVAKGGAVKILDFGLAKVVSPPGAAGRPDALTADTCPGTVLGTLCYMSPEQVRGVQTDARSDIFSFGCVLHEMLTQSQAFRRDTAADTMAAILAEDPPASEESVPPELGRVVTRCLRKDASERFQSAGELALALSDVGHGSRLSRRPRKLCVCGHSRSLPLCDGSHAKEGWTCSPETAWARLGFCASERYQNLAFKLASRYQGALCLPGEPWPKVDLLVTILDGTDLEFPTTALREISARDRLVVTLGVTGAILGAAIGPCRCVDLGGCALFDAFARITEMLDGKEGLPARENTPARLHSAFISHAVRDEPTIVPVVAYLRRYFQADLFLCADSIPTGTRWQHTIMTSLRGQDRFVMLLSHASLASHFCSFEIGAANAMAKPIALISLDGSLPPMFAQDIQAVDLPRLVHQQPWLTPQDVLLRELLLALGPAGGVETAGGNVGGECPSP